MGDPTFWRKLVQNMSENDRNRRKTDGTSATPVHLAVPICADISSELKRSYPTWLGVLERSVRSPHEKMGFV